MNDSDAELNTKEMLDKYEDLDDSSMDPEYKLPNGNDDDDDEGSESGNASEEDDSEEIEEAAMAQKKTIGN